MKKDKQGSSFMHIFGVLLKLSLKYEGAFSIFHNSVSILHGAAFGAIVFARQWFFDSVAVAAVDNSKIVHAIWMLVVFGILTVVQQALNGACNFMIGLWFEKFNNRMKRVLAKKAAKVDPSTYENTELLDKINKAGAGAENSGGMLFTLVGILTFYLPYFVVVGVFLYMKKPILAVSIVLVFVPVLISQFIRAKVFTKLEDDLAPLRRRYEGFENTICDRDYFKETRLLGGFRFLRARFSESLKAFCKMSNKAERKTALWETLMMLFTLSGYVGILYLLFTALINNEISVGVFAAVFAEVDMMFGIMDEIICRHIGSVAHEIGSVRNFIDFLDFPERLTVETGVETVPQREAPALSLKNVSYKYPGSERRAVDGVTLDVRPFETLAVVGENGAGKTTLVRLLTGLYLPTEGEATIDGANTRDVPLRRLFERTSAVFQKFMRYRLTLDENVRVSDCESADEIEPSLVKADMSASDESFPDGANTVLSREFDGVDISGGQWQRVAIARGFFRKHKLIVLDEPTSAIDPLEETRVYRKFAELSKSATSIIVTHRMGSARIADRIIVMKQGKIVEQGTHDDLMTQNGCYAEMANAQADWYK